VVVGSRHYVLAASMLLLLLLLLLYEWAATPRLSFAFAYLSSPWPLELDLALQSRLVEEPRPRTHLG
jgi:hypothetical protein